MPIEVVNLVAQGALGVIFAYLYWDERKQRQAMQTKYDLDIQRIQEQRVNELKLIARLPTDLDANYTLPAKAA